MAHDGVPPPPARPSWHEREMALALQRLATARVRVASLEEAMAAPAAAVTHADPADVARLQELDAEIAKLRPKASSRFGGGSARERIDELEVQRRLVLDRLGVDSYDEHLAREQEVEPAPAVDPDVMAFAQAEFESAQQAFMEVASMVIPDADPNDEVFERTDAAPAAPPADSGERDADVIPLVKPQAS